ncbi:hypothetical protein JT358_03150 [Micrococcales bacterium 31B]|nr:hypothetical protein [Micrococcales bacterium 31B]
MHPSYPSTHGTHETHETRAAANVGKKPFRLAYAYVALAHAVLLILQPILAGISLQGSDAALDLHYYNGMAIMTVAVLQIVAALLWWKPGGGGTRGISVSAVLLVLELAQFVLGSNEVYSVHLPLGILTLVDAVMAARLGYRSTRSTPRAPRGRSAGRLHS